MLKKITIAFFAIFFCSELSYANFKGANIFRYSRDVPNTKITKENGDKVSLQDFKGKLTLVIFWSRNCIPCIKSLDDISEFSKKVKNDGIEVVIISKDYEWDEFDNQRTFLNKFGASDLIFYTDSENKLNHDFAIISTPHTVIVNKSSQEIGRIKGSIDWSDEDTIDYFYKLKAQKG